MSQTRFTTWLSSEELDKIAEASQRMSTSKNLIIRFAIRDYFGLPIPREAEKTHEIEAA